jgi:TolB-like protein
MSFFEELKRRNVFRVGLAYLIAAWVLLQVTDVVGEILELPPWGGKLILLMLVVGFPLALIFAWAFEMTPEGIKREKDVDRSQSITQQTGRKLDRTIIAVLAVAVTYLLVDKLYLQDVADQVQQDVAKQELVAKQAVAESQSPSIAVLPFVNMSGDADNEYFSDGLTETLLHMLAQLPELRVAARTSSFAFKGQNKSITEMAGTLGVAHILEGSVQKSGERVRVTAQLIRAEDGFHVWSQNYTRPLEDIFAIQDEIASDVAQALDASLLGAENTSMHGVETNSVNAYELYLKAMEQQAINSYSSLELAENYFKQALAADPGFIEARLGLVRNYMQMYGTGLVTKDTVATETMPLLEQVKAVQPDNPEAHAMDLVMQTWDEDLWLDNERRERVYQQLEALLPLIPGETFAREVVVAHYAYFQQDYEKALQIAEAGLLVDPLSARLHTTRGRVYETMDEFDKARSAYLRALELEPENPNRYGRLSGIAAKQGKLVEKLSWMRKAAQVDPQDHELAFHLAEDFYDLKLFEEGDRWAEKVYALAPNSAIARKMEMLAALSKDRTEEALSLARKMIEDRIENRRNAFGDAVFTFAALMIMDGRAKEAYDYLVAQEPSITDFSVLVEGIHAGAMQGMALPLKKEFAPPEEVQKDWQQVKAALEAIGLPWRNSEHNRLWDAQVRGDLDEAARVLLTEIWDKPVASFIARSSDIENAMYPELLDRPDVAARKRERDEEFKAARLEVEEFLLSPEWNDQ